MLCKCVLILVTVQDSLFHSYTVYSYVVRNGHSTQHLQDAIVITQPLIISLTCKTGAPTRNFSRKALGDMSYLRHVARCSRMLSMVWRGCWRVMRRYFCNGRESEGKIEDADSEGLRGVLGAGKKGNSWIVYLFLSSSLKNMQGDGHGNNFVTYHMTLLGRFEGASIYFRYLFFCSIFCDLAYSHFFIIYYCMGVYSISRQAPEKEDQ